MRKIGIVAAVVFVASWMFSLLCMHAAGQAGWKMEEENQNVISESVVYENNQKGSEETAGWNGNSHSVDQGDGEVYSRRIILERYGVRTYLSVEDYLPGVMVCQTGPEMGMEALKCQAVIARTYIYRQMGDREEIQEEELDLDYLGDDTARAGNTLTVHQKEELAKRLEQCRQAAEATAGVVMKYEDRYILHCFMSAAPDGHGPGRQTIRICSRWRVNGISWEASRKHPSVHRNLRSASKISVTPHLWIQSAFLPKSRL